MEPVDPVLEAAWVRGNATRYHFSAHRYPSSVFHSAILQKGGLDINDGIRS